MKYDFRHIDPRTGLPKVIKNNEPEIQMMNRLPGQTGWIYLLQNRISLNTVGNQRYKKKVWYDRRDCTVSTDQTKEDAQNIRVAKFPNLGRPAGWIYASDIREFFNLKFTKSLNETRNIKDVKKGERIIFWTEDQLDLDDAWPAVGTMIFDKAGNPSLIGILNPMAHNECCGYISFDMISKWNYVDKVFPKGKTEDRLIQAISDSLVESGLFNDEIFNNDDDDFHISDELINYVDLGLPSGTIWCSRNLGASIETDYGDYYYWGETEEFNERSPIFKYTNTGRTELLPEDDIIYQSTNGKCKMPTKEQIKELYDYTDHEWVKNYNDSGVDGEIFRSKKLNRFMFIPAAGAVFDDFTRDLNRYVYLWSSSVYKKDSKPSWNDEDQAHILYYNKTDGFAEFQYSLDYKFPVRGVLVLKSK